ncbi:MAG: transglutaminase domain-containing protein [Phycisphaeraceae bacterium]|nr:transglutaminase domain-containing protein [Phycisphaeraceae bacterium]
MILRRKLLVLAAGLVASLTMPSLGQPRGQQPAQSFEGKRNPKYVEWHNPKFVTLSARVHIQSYQERAMPTDRMPRVDYWDVQQASIVFPVLRETGSSEAEGHADPQAGPDEGVTSTLSFADREQPVSMRFIDQFPVGARYGHWRLGSQNSPMLRGRELELLVQIPMIVYRTRYHDEAAEQVDWPQGAWPPVAQSAFQPMSYVDHSPREGPYDLGPVRALLAEWTGSTDPAKWRQLKPAVLAKFLAGKVVEHVQLSGDGIGLNHRGQIESVMLSDIGRVAATGRASPFEMACLLAAVYREAGIPARTVIGVRAGRSDDLDFLRRGSRNRGELHAWVEWCLYDERDKSVTWVPVDPVEIRKSSSRMRRNYWTQPIRFFGTHDRLDTLAPMSFHFFPPTTVQSYSSSGSPGFWGWLVDPVTPEIAVQALQFSVGNTPVRAGQRRTPQPR